MKNIAKHLSSLFLQLVIVVAITIALLEGLVHYSLSNPEQSLIPKNILFYIYERHDRKVIQTMIDCAAYHSELTYKLLPGECEFNNREFETRYKVNSAGFRDDEVSLSDPKIVSLGDSFAMGWGVRQNETYTDIIEKETGLLTLNTGTSSYGTPRELKLLAILDYLKPDVLLLQYTDNDIRENRGLFDKGSHITLSREEWDKAVEYDERQRDYYLGQYALTLLIQIKSGLEKTITNEPAGASAEYGDETGDEVKYFINALNYYSDVLKQPKIIIIFELGMFETNNDFVSTLNEHLESSQLPKWIKDKIRLVDLSRLLESGMYYPLDGHITAEGHKRVAEALIIHLEEIVGSKI